MDRTAFDILVVGPQIQFREIFDHLESQGNYRLHYAADYQIAAGYLSEFVPDAIILTTRAEERSFTEEMDWLDKLKKDAPVLVVSWLGDPHLYKIAMDHGAFDFFTAWAPPDEIDRELSKAISLQPSHVA